MVFSFRDSQDSAILPQERARKCLDGEPKGTANLENKAIENDTGSGVIMRVFIGIVMATLRFRVYN